MAVQGGLRCPPCRPQRARRGKKVTVKDEPDQKPTPAPKQRRLPARKTRDIDGSVKLLGMTRARIAASSPLCLLVHLQPGRLSSSLAQFRTDALIPDERHSYGSSDATSPHGARRRQRPGSGYQEQPIVSTGASAAGPSFLISCTIPYIFSQLDGGSTLTESHESSSRAQIHAHHER
jgi:hypothetical protein